MTRLSYHTCQVFNVKLLSNVTNFEALDLVLRIKELCQCIPSQLAILRIESCGIPELTNTNSSPSISGTPGIQPRSRAAAALAINNFEPNEDEYIKLSVIPNDDNIAIWKMQKLNGLKMPNLTSPKTVSIGI